MAGSPRRNLSVLAKRNANAVAFLPNDLAGPEYVVRLDDQLKRAWHRRGAFEFEASADCREMANKTIHAPIPSGDRARLEGAQAWRPTVVHAPERWPKA